MSLHEQISTNVGLVDGLTRVDPCLCLSCTMLERTRGDWGVQGVGTQSTRVRKGEV